MHYDGYYILYYRLLDRRVTRLKVGHARPCVCYCRSRHDVLRVVKTTRGVGPSHTPFITLGNVLFFSS